MNTKEIAFVATMSALGITLSTLSLNIAPILSSVGQGGAALDLSHIATFIAAIFGGPYVGALVGFIGGIYAGYYFGYVLGSLGVLSLIGIPFGKALTGLTAGFIYNKLKISNRKNSSLLTTFTVLISYIPECIFTIIYFLYIVTFVYGYGMSFMIPIVIPKAWIEITVMSIIMGALAGNIGFKEFMLKFFTKTSKPQLKT
ncbi:ECF transporter S component [Candidatus Bathyarchaeota archaeon]|nr:ECF transporter S component [Candidatus Bathyarchaeota archaeon]